MIPREGWRKESPREGGVKDLMETIVMERKIVVDGVVKSGWSNRYEGVAVRKGCVRDYALVMFFGDSNTSRILRGEM